MSFWREHMPKGMRLRSTIRASSFAHPERRFSLADFGVSAERELENPLPLEDFLEYASWYRDRASPTVDGRLVASLHGSNGGFEVTLEDGEAIGTRKVIVAAGIAPFAHRPPVFRDVPNSFASHSLEHNDLSTFTSQRVLVVGGGQSALESAALLHEGGADVEVLLRSPRVRWLDPPPGDLRRLQRLVHDLQYPPTEVGPRGFNWFAAAPDLYRATPKRLQRPIGRRCIAPAGADWLRARLADVNLTVGRRITSVATNGRVRVELDDGSVRKADHVLLATGYRVDVRRYPFLADEVLAGLRLRGGYPELSAGLEASVPGLHFLGAPAAASFGPIMRFVCGTWYAAGAVTAKLLGRRRPPRMLSW
jgi:NADPH-dependent 2,4-dienoyl-CoA reductase/sulfur reductase-like enzyme